MTEATPRDPIVEFWQAARGRIKDVGLLAALHEVNSSQLVTPPAWSFGDSPEGSVAKIVKLEHAWRRLDGRNDDGFQVAPFPG